MKRILLLGMALILTFSLAGCGGGGDDRIVVGPGLVGIDDSTIDTAPLLTVTYVVPPSVVVLTANILSDPASDGDIEFDPVLNTFFVTTGPSVVLFGEDSLNGNLPEFRAFLTFPLDGTTNQDIVPSDALIVSATLEVLVDQVSFASIVPSFIDMVEYPVAGLSLSAADFNSVPLDFQTLEFFSSDQGQLVRIDVTPFMQLAQVPPALLDFQVRFLVDTGVGPLALSRPASKAAVRTVRPAARAQDNMLMSRGSTSRSAATPVDKASRHR